MPYKVKQFDIVQPVIINDFLVTNIGFSKSFAQSLLQKGRILDHKNRRLQNKQTVKTGYINVSVFEAQTQGLKPLFESEHFALFDKPSGVMVHPVHNSTQYTLLDEIRYHFGEKASLVHRIDAETSGLVLVSKNKYSEMILKEMFEEKAYIKKYHAYVEGQIQESFEINKGIKSSEGSIKIKMETSPLGKTSQTVIKPLSFNTRLNQTLVEAIPLTGRQHQIRVHLDSIGHRIVGDPIYGLEESFVNKLLNKKVSKEERVLKTGEKRLMLHAHYLAFTYLNINYSFCSKQEF